MKLSRKFFTSLFASSILVTQTTAINADDWDYWAVKTNADPTGKGYDIYTVNNDTGEATLRDTKCIIDPGYGHCESGLSSDSAYVDPTSGDLWLQVQNNIYSYNLETDAWTDRGTKWKNNYTVVEARSSVSNTSDGSINIGSGSDILLKKKTNGEYHLGENSFVTKEENGKQNIWGQDTNGTKIPLNVQGSDFQIDGVSVQDQIDTNKSNISTNTSNIKNLGEGVAGSTALTAALTALPQTSKESKLSCGVGTGAYSSRYAVGFGCASKVNKRVDINAGGSYIFGGSKSYGSGTLDSGVVKAGFVFKLGELNNPTQISMKDKKIMERKIESLEEKNKKILSTNQTLENKLTILMAKIEKIEKIALRANKSKDIAVYKLK